MPIQFQAVERYLDEHDGISLPIGDKSYTIPAPSALTGLEVTRLMAAMVDASAGKEISDDTIAEIAKLDEEAGSDLERRILGPALDEMIADGVPWPMVQLAFQTAMVWISQGAETAAIYWTSGGGAMGKAPNRQTRRSTPKARRASTASKRRAK